MPDQTDASRRLPLEAAMQEALAGSREAARAFFKLLLEAPLFVPERRQEQPLSNAPRYPNEFFNFLGVQDRQRTVMPAFTDPDFIRAWCGNALAFRETSFRSLAAILPEEWWLVVNPGRAVEKELSPWEIARLKEGAPAIEEVLDEIFAPATAETLDLRPCAADEYPALRAALRRAGAETPALSRIYLLREEGRDPDGRPLERLLVGVEAREAAPDEIERLRVMIRDAARPFLIGGEELKVLAGRDWRASPAFGLFKDAPPLYARPRLAALWGCCRRRLRRKIK